MAAQLAAGNGPVRVFTLTETDPLFLVDEGAFWNKAAIIDFTITQRSLCVVTYSMVVEVPKPSEAMPAPASPGFLESVEGICKLDPAPPELVEGGIDAAPVGPIRFGDNHGLTTSSPLRYKHATTFTWVLPHVTPGAHKISVLLRYNIDMAVSPPSTNFANPSANQRTLVIQAVPVAKKKMIPRAAHRPTKPKRRRS